MYGNPLGSEASRPYNPQAGASAPPPTSALQEVLQQQERFVETLHERIGQLESRLDPVLMPEQPAPPNRASGAETAAPTSQHHMRGMQLADCILQATARLEDVLHRLQV